MVLPVPVLLSFVGMIAELLNPQVISKKPLPLILLLMRPLLLIFC